MCSSEQRTQVRQNWLAVLNVGVLVILAWTLIIGRAPVAAPAAAGLGGGIPDAGSQRLQMIAELRDLNTSMDRLIVLLEKSELRVKVTSMPASASSENDDK